jgi:phenylacetate-CoA ligase
MLATLESAYETNHREQLAVVLSRCFAEVPLYRRLAGAPGLVRPESALEILRELPWVTRQDIRRDFPRNFLRDDSELQHLLEQEAIEVEYTSGTSDERAALVLPRDWWAAQELRALRLNRLAASVLTQTPDARRVSVLSPMCSNDICYTGVPSRNERIVGNALFVTLSRFPFLWGERDLARMAAEAVEWDPQFLDVDPVYGVAFALYCERHNIRLPSLRFILVSYEFPSTVHQRILTRVFGVPTLNLYGSTETGHLLMEEGAGQMLPVCETAFLELVGTDSDTIAELVVTTLTNPFMPLLRYRIGDLVEMEEGRYRVHGRVADAFNRPGGRVTTLEVDRCLTGVEGIAHYQLLERVSGPWLLRFIPDGDGPSPIALKALREQLTDLLSAGEGLKLEVAEVLAPEPSGKFRLGYPAKSG